MAERAESANIFETDNPERALVATYAPDDRRMALLSLLALDDVLADVPRTTNEPALGQMRLVWWRDALIALETAPAPAQPVLRALEREVLPHGVNGLRLGDIAEGWAVLVENDELDEDAMRDYARGRGGALFECAGVALGDPEGAPLAQAGAGWALADLARNLSDRAAAERAAGLARPMLDVAVKRRWPVALRALGALTHLAWLDLKTGWDQPIAPGSPRRVARLAWHRMSGR